MIRGTSMQQNNMWHPGVPRYAGRMALHVDGARQLSTVGVLWCLGEIRVRFDELLGFFGVRNVANTLP